MSGNTPSVTGQRILGAMLFIPVVAVFLISQPGAQWMFLAIAGIMVWELAGMVRLSMPLRLTVLMDFVLFALPAPLFARLELVAGMSLLPVVAALAALVVGFVWMTTRDKVATGFSAVDSLHSGNAWSARA